MKHIFRAYDIRGIWGQDLDPSIAMDIGYGLGAFLKEDLGFSRVSLGYDIRTTSKAMADAVISALLSSGIDVISLGQSSFGIALYGGYAEGVDASCFITASHLGPEWNGLKIYFGDGVGFPEEHIMSIRDRVLDRRFSRVDWRGMGNAVSEDYSSRYRDFWVGRYGGVLSGSDLRIGVDCGGSMCLSAPDVISGCGVGSETVNCELDPHFKGRPSEPKPEYLGELRDLVIEKGLSLGVAFDGDGDRAVIVDDRGRFLSSDTIGIIMAKNLLQEKGGGLVLANVESSMAIEDVLLPLGAEVKRIKVGHTFLTLEAKQYGAIFGVERSGHMIIPDHVLFDDAIVTPLEVMRILATTGQKLSDIVDGVPQYPMDAVAVECPDETKFSVVESLKDEISAEFERVNTMDGVRVDTDDGWVLIRCSNTSPMIRLTVEGREISARDKLKGEFLGRLNKVISGDH